MAGSRNALTIDTGPDICKLGRGDHFSTSLIAEGNFDDPGIICSPHRYPSYTRHAGISIRRIRNHIMSG